MMERPKINPNPDYAQMLGVVVARNEEFIRYSRALEAYATELEKEITALKAKLPTETAQSS